MLATAPTAPRRRPAAFPTLTDDPLGFRAGDANLYRFVGNSAVNRVDPSGLVQEGNPLDQLSGGFGGGRGALRQFDPLATFTNPTPVLSSFDVLPSDLVSARSFATPSFGPASSVGGVTSLTVHPPALNRVSSLNVGSTRAIGSGASQALSGFGQSVIDVGLGLTSIDNYFTAAIGVGLASDLAIPAPPGGFGHHWVPDSVVRNHLDQISPDAKRVFDLGFTGALPYNHGFDTWGTDRWGRTTHSRYNQAVGVLLRSRAELSSSGKISRSAAEEFVTFLETGVYNNRGKLSTAIKRSGAAADAIAQWRSGFHKGIAAAQHALIASERNGATLSRYQLKAIAQQEVNGVNTPAFARHYDEAARQYHAGYQRLPAATRTRLLLKAAGRSLGAVSAFYLASAARSGFAGENPERWTGFAGAYAGVSAELAQKELVETAIKGAARGVFNGIFDFENQQERLRSRFDEYLPPSDRNSR